MKKSLMAAIVIITLAALTDLPGEAIAANCTINIPDSVIQVLVQKLSE
jgi:hypothetical protein